MNINKFAVITGVQTYEMFTTETFSIPRTQVCDSLLSHLRSSVSLTADHVIDQRRKLRGRILALRMP